MNSQRKITVISQSIFFMTLLFIAIACNKEEIYNGKIKLIPFQAYNKWGFVDKNKNIVISPQYDQVGLFNEGISIIQIGNNYGAIDSSGYKIIPIKYDFISNFNDGVARIQYNNKYGLIDRTGNLIVDFLYDFIHLFHDGLARVKVAGKYGFIDKTGKIVIKIQDIDYDDFSEGYARFGIFQYKNFIESITSPIRYVLSEDNHIIDLKTTKQKLTRDGLDYHDENFRTYKVYFGAKNRYGFINKKGEVVIDAQYFDAGTFKNGLAAVRLNDKWGYIDNNNKLVIDYQYDEAAQFINDYAIIGIGNISPLGFMEGGKYGLINKKGELVISAKYTRLDDYGEVILFRDGDEVGILNRNGEIENHIKYDFYGYKDGFIIVSLFGKEGVIGINGEEILPLIYDAVSIVDKDLFYVHKGDTLGYQTKGGYKYWEK